jgi:hypothetical protein
MNVDFLHSAKGFPGRYAEVSLIQLGKNGLCLCFAVIVY